jgi:hypothetical protein
MNSLTETAYHTRKAINIFILVIIAYVILRMLAGIFFSILLAIFPPKPPAPNHAFGVLPSLQFPKQASPAAQLVYKLETVSGSVPAASVSANVYFIPPSNANFLAINKTQKFAEKFQFSPEPIQESKTLYRFTDPQYSLRTLRYDILTSNFAIQYDYNSDTSVFNGLTVPTFDAALKLSRDNLNNNFLLPTDFQGGSVKTTYLMLVGNTLVPSISVTQANAVRIDFQRAAINGLSVYYANPNQGPIYFIFSGSNDIKKNMLEFTYIYWPVDYQTKATYGLKTSTQAWQELQSGKAYYASLPIQGNNITVRSIHLGYFDSIDSQTYMRPIFVFEGDDNFVAYVDAIAAPWTE